MAVVDWAARAAALRECGQARLSINHVASLWGVSRQAVSGSFRRRGMRFTSFARDATKLAAFCESWGVIRSGAVAGEPSTRAFPHRVSEWWHLWGCDWVSRRVFEASGENGRMWLRMLERFRRSGVPHEVQFDGLVKLVRLTPDVESWLAAQGL